MNIKICSETRYLEATLIAIAWGNKMFSHLRSWLIWNAHIHHILIQPRCKAFYYIHGLYVRWYQQKIFLIFIHLQRRFDENKKWNLWIHKLSKPPVYIQNRLLTIRIDHRRTFIWASSYDTKGSRSNRHKRISNTA